MSDTLTFDGDVCTCFTIEVLDIDAIADGSQGPESARECDRGGKSAE